MAVLDAERRSCCATAKWNARLPFGVNRVISGSASDFRFSPNTDRPPPLRQPTRRSKLADWGVILFLTLQRAWTRWGRGNGNRHRKAGDPIVAFHEGKIPVIVDALEEGRPISRIALARLTRWTNSMTALELS